MKIFILILSIIISLIPISLIGYYFYNKDTVKEPKWFLFSLFLSGIFSGIIVMIISLIGIGLIPIFRSIPEANSIILLIIYSYIFIALIEELSKLFMIYKISYHAKEFDQTYDIILYSIFVGLGFVCFENIIYIISNPNIETSILRSLTAVPAHICFQIIMGNFLYMYKYQKKKKYLLFSLILPMLLHGTYNILIFLRFTSLVIIDMVFLAILIYYSQLEIKKVIEIDKNNLKKLTQ